MIQRVIRAITDALMARERSLVDLDGGTISAIVHIGPHGTIRKVVIRTEVAHDSGENVKRR